LGSGRKKPSSRPSPRPSVTASRSAPPLAASPKAASPSIADNQFPVVGVGASAGGLEAFRQLLKALPIDTGMAYVLVQHLDPVHESILAELLAKGSRMPVAEVREDTRIEPNRVYVTPGQQDVAIEGSVLKLVPRTTTGGRHLPIDSFLRSLAMAQGAKAIGVILSGTGSDGTLGATAIKAEGGIAFAQEPASAAYDGMPRSAIASGCVDFVLAPAGIAEELVRLSRHPYVIAPARGEGERAGEALPSVLTLLRTATGADFSAYKQPTIRRRISRRMALVNADTLAEYQQYLKDHADEVRALYQDCLITVTSFFRDPGAFQALRQECLARLAMDRSPDTPVRVWVPGCATGEEVYSIVISLLEASGELNADRSFQVFGTDLSDGALEKARGARYPRDIARDVSPERLRRFFTEVDGGYQVIKAIRDMCVFARHDVTRDPPFSRMDLISCRNMLIYLEPRQQQRVLAFFHYALLPRGLLLLGASETARTSDELFAPVDRKNRIYSRRPTAAPAVFGFGAPGPGRGKREPAPMNPRRTVEELLREADRILLAKFAPAGVIVDGNDNIVEFRGENEPFLEHTHGRASLNLFKMTRKGLLLGMRQAIQEARKRNATVRKAGVSFRQGTQIRRLDLEVVPLKGSLDAERALLVLFEAHPESKGAAGRRSSRRATADGAEAREVAKLRQELGEATRYLQAMTQQHEAANEELQASNEEILSANEELQSINEELETAKEELQASNEEMATLNQELQGRNLQIGRALEYANGIVETVRTPLLILDSALRVTRANGSFYDYFRVEPDETLGKLVYELGDGQWDIPVLRQALDEILFKTPRLDDIEVEHDFPRVGRRILVVDVLRLRREGGQEGVLLAFEDKTAARTAEKDRDTVLALEQEARQRAEHADRIKDEFVATASHELRGPLTAMVGWLHVLRTAGIDEATRERGLAAIGRGVDTQVRLIEDLLDYSSVVTGKLRLAPRLMDLMPVAAAAIGAARVAADAKGIRLELAAETASAVVRGDPDRLQQVLWNLLSNAVKFTPRGGRIEMWIGQVGASVHIRVTDTGKGISPDFIGHVFERFRQQDGTPQRAHGGLGLGLAIVEELVELHGGTIRAESPGEGQGATFTMTLPVQKLLVGSEERADAPEPSGPTTAPGGTEPGALAGVRLLVVDAESDSRKALTVLFEESGANVVAAASASEALETVRGNPPDVLVRVVGSPHEDGYELIRNVRAFDAERGVRVPALALTVHGEPRDRVKALVAGFDAEMARASEPSDLVAQAALLAGAPRRARP
jgi:two-component system, chemotaxis family, CheB/CheR fusion protein